MNISITNYNTQKLKHNAPLLTAIMLMGFLFVDLPSEQLMGTIARCPNLLFAPIIFLYIHSCTKQFVTVKLAKYVFNYAVISTITAILMLCITVAFVTYGGWYVYTEFMPVKLVKAATYNFLNALTIYNLYILVRFVSIENLYKILYGCTLFLTVYGFVELIVPYPIPGIHGTLVYTDEKRLQLTTAEPVTATIVYATYLSATLYLRIYLHKQNLVSAILGAVGMLLLLLIGSKGGVIFLVVAVLLAIRKKISVKVLLLGTAATVPAIYLIVNNIVPMLLVDIEQFTSFSTRATTWVVAFEGLLYYPVGQGFGTYLVYFPSMMIPTCKWLSSLIGIPLNTAEMDNYIHIGKYLGAKSGIPNEVMFNGFTAIVYIYLICKYQVKKFKQLPNHAANLLFSFIFYFLFLEFLFIVTFETMYFIFLPIVVIDRILANQFISE